LIRRRPLALHELEYQDAALQGTSTQEATSTRYKAEVAPGTRAQRTKNADQTIPATATASAM
jgi:hypothetical protein